MAGRRVKAPSPKTASRTSRTKPRTQPGAKSKQSRTSAKSAPPAGSGPPAASPEPSAADRAAATSLVAWFEGARRTLPWRKDYAPYGVWIAEMMLQQTQVETVLPYYARWMERFPTIGAVASAPLEAVLKVWEGLGYYGRARNLHQTAQAVMQRHGGRLPDDAEALRALPGVGPYTAGAIASIAFNRPEPIVDGNVARVLGRLHAQEDDPASPEGKRAAWAASAALLAGAVAEGLAPRACNEALMELGALVCRPRAPQCLLCPWQEACRARRSGDPEAYPPRVGRKARPVRSGVMLLARRAFADAEPTWLLRLRPPKGIWGGLWEFPWAEQQAEEETLEGLCAGLLAEAGVGSVAKSREFALVPVGHVSHGLTHFQLELDCFLLALGEAELPLGGAQVSRRDAMDRAAAGGRANAGASREDRAQWVTRAELEGLPLARLSHKALALVDRLDQQQAAMDAGRAAAPLIPAE